MWSDGMGSWGVWARRSSLLSNLLLLVGILAIVCWWLGSPLPACNLLHGAALINSEAKRLRHCHLLARRCS